jgi:hypothetical protein
MSYRLSGLFSIFYLQHDHSLLGETLWGDGNVGQIPAQEVFWRALDLMATLHRLERQRCSWGKLARLRPIVDGLLLML